MQRTDGGWGEDGKSYYSGFENIQKQYTLSNLVGNYGFIAAGQIDCKEVEKGN